MEKLIELLNEYIEKNINTPNRCVGYSCSYFGFDGGTDVIEDTIISKRYGFIKWLVDNDKIETNNLSLKAFKNIFGGGGFVEVSDLEVLLMLLAISDTPIDDLISYLK